MKISKVQAKAVGDAQDEIGTAYTKVCAAIDRYNDEVGALYAVLQTELQEYNEAVEVARATIEEVAAGLREKVEARSDKWRESDEGNAVDAWVSEWEEFVLAEAEADEPDAIKHPEDPNDAFNGLTHEVE